MKVVQNSSPDVRPTDVRWVITVPAIWKDSAKKFMRQAAEQVRIVHFFLYRTCLKVFTQKVLRKRYRPNQTPQVI